MSKLIDLNNPIIKTLLKSDGFCLWEDDREYWKPEDQVVDWSSDYDQALEKFAESCIKITLRVIDTDIGALSAEEQAGVLLGIQQRFGKGI